MLFYRVREQYDQFPKNPKVRDGNILIAGELYTEKELDKLPYIYAGAFEQVNIRKKDTYYLFGARFALPYQKQKDIKEFL